MRVYDPRIGKFLSVDPITSQFPELTPYQFASNSPIFNIDLDGLEGTSWWHRFLYDPVNTLMTGTTWEDANAAAGDINNQIPVGAIINGSFQAITARDPVFLQPASRIDGVGNAVIGGIFHASAVHVSIPPINSVAALLTEEIDVITKAVKIEVKEGTSVKGKQLENLIISAAKEGKKPVLFAPEINPKTGPSLEKQFPGLKIFTDWKKLGDFVIGSAKPKS